MFEPDVVINEEEDGVALGWRVAADLADGRKLQIIRLMLRVHDYEGM